MSEAEHLYECATECRDLAGHVDKLPDHELRMLARHCVNLQSRNGGEGGVPALVAGMCDTEAAKRFYQENAEKLRS